MSNYSKTTDFAAKDSLPSGDSGKIIRGSEFETEFDNISTAIATKADAADPTFTGTVTIDGLTVNGNTTLGNAATDTVTVTADIASNLIPSADDTYNLGASGAEWNDLFIDGTANIDSLVADTADINGGTIDGVTIGGSSAGAITGTTITGTSFVTSGDMTFGDNDKAIFGAGSDLQIYHDGSNSYIEDAGGGNLRIRSNGGTGVIIDDGTYTLATFDASSNNAKLYHNGNQKLETTSTGIDVTGSVTADGLTVQGDAYFDTNNAGRALHITRYGTVESESANFTIDDDSLIVESVQDEQYGGFSFKATRNGVGTQNRLNIDNNGDISFYEDTGTTAKLFWDASAESLGIGTSSPVNTGANYGDLTINGTDGSFISLQSGGSTTGVLQTISTETRLSTSVASGSLTFRTDTGGSGTERMRIDAGGNVGIGESSPFDKLVVRSSDDNSVQSALSLKNGDIGTSAGVSLNFVVDDNNDVVTAAIYGQRTASAYHQGSLQFLTRDSGGAGLTERMRIDASGNLLVGTTDTNVSDNTTGGGININGDGEIKIAKNGTVLNLNRLTTDGEIIRFKKGGTTTVGSIGTKSGDLTIGTGDTGVRFDDANNAIYAHNTTTNVYSDATVDLGYSGIRFKDLYLSGGAYLGGAAAANKLDDYEEGTFTPTLIANGTDFTSVTYDGFTGGRYTKIGNLVHVVIGIRTDAITVGSASGDIEIAGLPFAGPSGGNAGTQTGTFVITDASNFSGDVPLSAKVKAGGSSNLSLFYRSSVNGNDAELGVSDLGTGTNANKMQLSGTYITGA